MIFGLNIYLSKKHICLLSKSNLIAYITNKLQLPVTVEVFDCLFKILLRDGLIKKSWHDSNYYLPFSRVLSFLSPATLNLIDSDLFEVCLSEYKSVDNNDYFANKVFNIFNNFDERSFWIALNRIGFWDNTTRTLEDLGKEAHITRERVRQLEKNSGTELNIMSTAKKF